MIKGENITVSANFDSGTFMSSFSVRYKSEDSYCTTDTNIQDVYNLDKTDFLMLEALIVHQIEKYLESKRSNLIIL